MGGNPEIYLFISSKDREIVELLNKLGIKVKIVNVDENNLRGYIPFNFGTNEIPLLVTKNTIIVGFKAIKEFINQLL